MPQPLPRYLRRYDAASADFTPLRRLRHYRLPLRYAIITLVTPHTLLLLRHMRYAAATLHAADAC